jgi:hypothetical protein
MSSPFAGGPNPYAASIVPPAPTPLIPAGPLPTSIDYLRSYTYIFDNPDWLPTALILALIWLVAVIAALIPGLGLIVQLFLLGYQFEVVDLLLKTQGRQYPAFDFGRFGDYLGRGLWPFLVYLVSTFVLAIGLVVVFFVGFVLIAVVAAAIGEDAGAVLASVFVFVGIAGMFVAIFVGMFYVTAMVLRSGLSQDFAAGFDFAWVHDFVRRMWVELLLAGLFLWITTLILELLGLMVFCIGILFALALVTLAFAHILYQLYAVYLARGGMPVAVKLATYPPMQPPTGMPPGYPPKPQ